MFYDNITQEKKLKNLNTYLHSKEFGEDGEGVFSEIYNGEL